MSLFQYIAQACQSLAATVAPSITAMGVHIVLALATIMMVWFGVQEALASAHGGPGFSMGRFLNLFMLLTFAYVMVNYYDSSIPGLGFSIKGFIDGGTTSLVNLIGADGSTSMLSEIHAASSKTGPSILNSMMNPYYAIVYFVVQFLLAMLAAIISAILAYGAIAATIIGLLGPIFIPFLVFDKLDWLFWGWLKAYLGFSFYKVVAAATLNVLSHVLTNYYIQLGQSLSDPSLMVQTLPLLILLVLVNIYILFKIPTMTHSLFTGGTGGHGGGLGVAVMAIRAAIETAKETRSQMSTQTANMETKGTQEITRAAERYLEQYGDPLVMNTYLKVTILVLGAVCISLAALTFKSQQALANMHPMIVSINDVGHAEAIDYRNFQYRPQEAENKYYLTRWAELYFSRNRFTIERDQTQSLYFLNSDVQRAVIDQERKDNSIQNYVKDSSLPYVDVEIKNVILDDLRQSPYSARIEFEKVYTNPADHSELKRERWTASVTYVFRENVKNNELAVNPLGLTIVRFRADQAFS